MCQDTPPCHSFIVHFLHHALHCVVGFGCDTVQEKPSWSFSGSTIVKR
jgi:hypothetical protein